MAGKYDGEIRIRTKFDNGSLTSQIMQVENRMEKTAQKAQKLESSMRELEKKKIPSDSYVALEKQFDVLVEKGKKLSESLKGTEKYVPAKQYVETEKALDSVSVKQDHLRKKMEAWVELGKKTNTTSYKKMQMDFAALGKEADLLIDKLKKMDENGRDKVLSEKWKTIKSQMAQTGAEASRVKAQMQEMESSGTAYINPKNTEEYQKLSEQLRQTNGEMDVLTKKHDELIAKQQKVGDVFKRTSGLISTMMSRLKGLALSLFIFNWISKGFNVMVNAFKEGIQNMAKYSSDFNARMSEMKSATATLRASLGSLAAPILSAIVPALVTLCSWLTVAVNAINKFISAITGKSTWTRAKQQQVDYAKSLNNTASAAKKAAGALQGFDELNVINSNSGSGSGGGAGGTSGAGYEEVPLTEKDFEWINFVKKAFEAILPIVIAIGAALLTWKITSFLTDLMKTCPILGTIASVLAIIGGALLLAWSLSDMWVNGVDWKNLAGYIAGTALAFGGLYALFGPFVAGIALIITSIAGFVAALKDIHENGMTVQNTCLLLISSLGIIVGVFLSFGGVAATVVAGIMLIIVGISDLIQNGVTLKNGILIVAGVFLGLVGTVGAVVAAITAFIAGLVLAVAADWENFKKTVWEPMKKWGQAMLANFEQIGMGIQKIFSGITTFLKGVFTGDWKTIWTGLKTFFEGIWDAIIGCLKASVNLIAGILNTVYNAICGVINACVDAINKISFTVPDFVPVIGGKQFGGFNIPRIQAVNIPYLANGGITTGSTLANIGEAGREAVLPLENNLSYLEPLAEMIASKMEGVRIVRIVPEESGIFKIVREGANDYFRRTGRSAFDF